jgi:hypothetical protein
MKQILFAFAALLTLSSVAQTPQENLDKYWKYRDRLRKDFLKIGDDNGESIPMSARSVGFAYGGVPEIQMVINPVESTIRMPLSTWGIT